MNKLYLPAIIPLILVVFLPAYARADAELFPATEVTKRYDVVGWVTHVWHRYQVQHADISNIFTIEPAAGEDLPTSGSDAASQKQSVDEQGKTAQHNVQPDGSEAVTNPPTLDIAGKPGTDGEPNATGRSEGQKSFAGKTIGATPALPKVTIGGQTIISKVASDAEEAAATLPDGLKVASLTEMLTHRYYVTPYAHSPQRGDPKAPVSVIEFVDLSCGQCMPELAKIDAVMLDYASNTVVTHIHAPTVRFQDTNMPAFYGKVANRGGVFWAYRDNVIKDKPVDANAIFDELVKSGMSVADTRTSMLTDARRFYRELDADSLLARSFGVSQPPVLFVNGIRVGENGVPLDKLSDVMAYVNARLQRGLPEPPK